MMALWTSYCNFVRRHSDSEDSITHQSIVFGFLCAPANYWFTNIAFIIIICI